jgi:hypothetical protein
MMVPADEDGEVNIEDKDDEIDVSVAISVCPGMDALNCCRSPGDGLTSE